MSTDPITATLDAHPAVGLWRHPDFLRLWAAQTVSQFGSQVTVVALPLTAVIALRAGPEQMGILGAAQFLPFVLVSLPAGALVDRLPRRRILVASDLGRAALLALIPVGAVLGALRIELLYAVAFLVGVLNVFFEVAYSAYLPALIPRERLVEGNSKLQTTTSAATIAGPGLAGVLVQAATAPLAITADAVSFVASALTLGRIRRAEARPDRPTRRHLVREILEGMRVVAAQPILRALTGCSVTANIFVNIYIAVSAIFAIRELGLSAAAFGALTAASGLGGLLGAAAATRVSRRLGIGPTLAVMQILAGLGTLSVSLVRGPAVLAGVELAGALVLWDCAVMVYVITSASLRQAIVPDALQGRVVASMRMITWGIPFVGFLLGGLLGERLGLRPTLVIAGLGNLLAAAWPLTRPIRTLRAAPATATVPPS